MSEYFVRLSDKLYLIPGEHRGRFPFANGLFIEGKTKALVDSGFGLSRIKAVQAKGRIEVIINTHFHLDHAYGNKFFPEAQIWAHCLDAPAFSSNEVFYAFTGFNKSAGIFPSEDHFPGGLEPRKVDRELKDDEILDFGGIKLQVIHTPGHTPGHISLFEPEQEILFSADVDLSPFGPWYGNLVSDIDSFGASIDRLLKLKPKLMVTSHADIVKENIAEQLNAYKAKIEQRDDIILKHLQVAKTISELVEQNIIFPRYPEPQGLYRLFEKTMLEKHIIRLLRQGKVVVKEKQKIKACI